MGAFDLSDWLYPDTLCGRQPQQPITAAGLLAGGEVWTPPGSTEGSEGEKLTLAGVSVQPAGDELCWVTDGATGDNITLSPKVYTTWTFVARLRRRAAQDDARILAAKTGASTTPAITCDTSTDRIHVWDGSAWFALAYLDAVFPVGEFRTFVFTWTTDRVLSGWVSGAATNTAYAPGISGHLDGGGAIGGRYNATYGAICQFDVAFVGVLGAPLSPEAARALSVDPYRLGSATRISYTPFSPSGASAFNLDLQDSTHAHASDHLALSSVCTIVVDDCLHVHTAEDLLLSSETSLLAGEAAHGHSADPLALSAESLLLVDGAAHGHLSTNATLGSSLFGPALESIRLRSPLGMRVALHSEINL